MRLKVATVILVNYCCNSVGFWYKPDYHWCGTETSYTVHLPEKIKCKIYGKVQAGNGDGELKDRYTM